MSGRKTYAGGSDERRTASGPGATPEAILEHDNNWQARAHALEQVLRIGSPAVPALLQSLETAVQRQFSPCSPQVVEALGRLRDHARSKL